jgi:hypothetical protein
VAEIAGWVDAIGATDAMLDESESGDRYHHHPPGALLVRSYLALLRRDGVSAESIEEPMSAPSASSTPAPVGAEDKKAVHAKGLWHHTFSALAVSRATQRIILQKKAPGRYTFDRPDYADITVSSAA